MRPGSSNSMNNGRRGWVPRSAPAGDFRHHVDAVPVRLRRQGRRSISRSRTICARPSMPASTRPVGVLVVEHVRVDLEDLRPCASSIDGRGTPAAAGGGARPPRSSTQILTRSTLLSRQARAQPALPLPPRPSPRRRSPEYAAAPGPAFGAPMPRPAKEQPGTAAGASCSAGRRRIGTPGHRDRCPVT